MRAAKTSAGNTSAPKPPRPAPEPSPEPCWTWPGSAPKPNVLRNPVERNLALHQSLPDLLRNLLRNPVELDLALHQSLLDFLQNLLRNLLLHQSLSGTFSGTLLNLTWLCTKATQTFSETGSAPKPPRPSPEPSPEPCWTWPGSPPKPPRPSPEPSPEPFWIDLALRQSLRETPSPEPSPEPCCTWPRSAPKLPRPAPEPSPEPCWTWLGLAPQPPRPSPEPSTLLALHQSFPGTFSGTFARTLLNVAWLCAKASQPSEPSPQPPWTWPGACTSSHRSYSGLKTPSAYAVGEKCKIKKNDFFYRPIIF